MSWMGAELERVAARMREGTFPKPVRKFTDSEKVAIAQKLQQQYGCTVWIDSDRLRYRFGLQGPRLPLAWIYAASLVGLLEHRYQARVEKLQVRFCKSA